jgi:hypothetical protein
MALSKHNITCNTLPCRYYAAPLSHAVVICSFRPKPGVHRTDSRPAIVFTAAIISSRCVRRYNATPASIAFSIACSCNSLACRFNLANSSSLANWKSPAVRSEQVNKNSNGRFMAGLAPFCLRNSTGVVIVNGSYHHVTTDCKMLACGKHLDFCGGQSWARN